VLFSHPCVEQLFDRTPYLRHPAGDTVEVRSDGSEPADRISQPADRINQWPSPPWPRNADIACQRHRPTPPSNTQRNVGGNRLGGFLIDVDECIDAASVSEASITPPIQQPPRQQPAPRIVSLVRRQPLVWFFVLAYAMSWPLILAGGLNPLAPAAAALIVLSLTQGRPGVKLLLRRAVKWRVPARWYAAALLLPPLFILAAVALTVATGAPMPTTEQLADWPGLIITFVVILLIGGGLEEVGWRGYGQARLQERHSALATATILAVLIAGCPSPAFSGRKPPPADPHRPVLDPNPLRMDLQQHRRERAAGRTRTHDAQHSER
jgi:hypothetical protein